MQNNVIGFAELEERLTPGISEVSCDAMGVNTFIGWSKEGDAVLQKDHNFTTVPELTWNLMNWEVRFEPETHIAYITEGDLNKLHNHENITDLSLSSEKTALHTYKVCMSIEKMYGDQQ